VDLPVYGVESQVTSTVSEGEGWGGDIGRSDPGALIISGHDGGGGDQDLDGRGGQLGEDAGNGNTAGHAALGSDLWAGDLSKFLPLVGAGRQELGAVDDTDVRRAGGVVIEPVGAPPGLERFNGNSDGGGTERVGGRRGGTVLDCS